MGEVPHNLQSHKGDFDPYNHADLKKLAQEADSVDAYIKKDLFPKNTTAQESGSSSQRRDYDYKPVSTTRFSSVFDYSHFNPLLKSLNNNPSHFLRIVDQPSTISRKVKDVLGDEGIKSWQAKFKAAFENSPGGRLCKLEATSPVEYQRRLREEWLSEPPLTGICMGLALEFIINSELGSEIPSMEPTAVARHFEKMLIPVMAEVCYNTNTTPDQLIGNENFDRVYTLMTTEIERVTGLKVNFQVHHKKIDTLFDQISAVSNGHHVFQLENPDGDVASNHIVYFNKEKGIIADGASGVVIKVEKGEDFNAIFSLYIETNYGNTSFTQFSIAKCVKPKNRILQKPSLYDRFCLRTKIYSLQVLHRLTPSSARGTLSDHTAEKL